VARHAGGEPFVVCGDFNSAPESPVWSYLVGEAGFRSAEQELGLVQPGDPRAFPTAGFLRLRMHLDHVFYGNGIRWLDLDGTHRFGDRRGSFSGLSDHVPIVGRFRLG
jgi:endonuclease/exonuclease/phosphatase family metal-dependent hydrolase